MKKLPSLVDVGKEEIEEVGRRLYGNFKFGSMGQVHTVYDAFHSVKDLMVISPTGSGKSNAYKIPDFDGEEVAASVCQFYHLSVHQFA